MPFDDVDGHPTTDDPDRGIANRVAVHRCMEGERNDEPNPAICSEISLHPPGERSLQHEKAVRKRKDTPRSRDRRRIQRRASHSADDIIGTKLIEAVEAFDTQHRRRIDPTDRHRGLLRNRVVEQRLARAYNSLHQFDRRPEAVLADLSGQFRLHIPPARQRAGQGFPALG